MRYMPRRGTRGPCSRVDIRRPMRHDVHVARRDVKRLAAAVIDRRGELGLTQSEFAKRCDVSVPTIQRVEAAQIEPRAKTLARLDRGAEWESGSARRTLSGGKPTPRATPVRIPPPDELVRMPIAQVLKVRERVREIEGDEAAGEWWREFLDFSERHTSRDTEHQP